MTPLPAVAALVPAWNAESFVEETLESLARQTYSNLRVLISVDLSTDRTAAVCEAFAARDARFEVVRQTQRLGWVGNTQALLRCVEEDYCLFAFHDDVLDATYVSELVACLEARPLAVIAFTDMDVTNQAGRVRLHAYAELEGVTDPVERGRRVLQRRGPWWTPNRGLLRSAVGRRIGGPRKHWAGEFSADWPWIFALALSGEFVRVPQTLCHKRYMKFSLSQTWSFRSWCWLAATLSCGRAVWSAPLGVGAKLALQPALLTECAGWIWRMLIHDWPAQVLGKPRA